MAQSDIQIGNVRNLLHKVVDDWRYDERRAVRNRLLDYEEKLEKIEQREARGEEVPLKQQTLEHYENYKSRVDAKYEMIDEAHRQMIAYVEGRAAE
ncbi:hypothetical protein [Aurantiacibacter sp. MUD61]|uniref:hypothetical protein n=1 Tax=Aurantiacibacter sp. MUD61 TaxID=3009083 RepID=UPI0022F02E0E|nr:hypothetical protein [Aurantiacibacter sp. MUD61]